MNSYRPEHDLLLSIGRAFLDDAASSRLSSLISQPLEWDYVYLRAAQHGIVPLLSKHLASARAVIPEQIFRRLQDDARINAHSNLYLIGGLLKVVRLFKSKGIRMAVFKGPVLSQMVYGEDLLRQAGDIDLLVERKHFSQAKEMLESLGYAMTPELTLPQLSSHLRSHCEIQFIRDDSFTVVDLHWGLAPKSFTFRLDPEEVMARLQPISFAGEVIETFAIEDLVLYQCFHGTKHFWSKLDSISTLSELIRSSPELDWQLLVARAIRARGKQMLALGLWLARQLGEAQVPDRLFTVIDADDTMRNYAAEIAAHLFDKEPPQPTPLRIFRTNLKVMDRRRDAFVSLVRSIFVPTFPDWEALALPAALHPLYYALRPLRLSKCYLASAWHRVLLGKQKLLAKALRCLLNPSRSPTVT